MIASSEVKRDASRYDEVQPPLIVSLENTLVRTDFVWEALALYIRTRFLQLWRLGVWWFEGKASFRNKLLQATAPAAENLPYDQDLLVHLKKEREKGRRLVLITSQPRFIADSVATHTGLFDHVHAAESGVAFDMHAKAHLLLEVYGNNGFDYIGSQIGDREMWKSSRTAYSVAKRPLHIADERYTEQIGAARRGRAEALIKALRPRQWLKNLLVFVPMLAGHDISVTVAFQSLLAFVAFSLCASSAYLLNDTLDAADDRVHPTKRSRPIAAGTLPIAVALCACPLLAVAALLLSAAVNTSLLAIVSLYLLSTLSYSLYLKRVLMVDIVTLAILYSMRILGGSAATGIEPSFWLLAFSFFIFLSLALLKRHSELYNLEQLGKEKTAGRGYTTADRGPIGIMGLNSAFLSVLIFILYFESQNALIQYDSPAWLAGIVPLLVFWLGRLWILSYRGQVNEDPILYVSRDRVSLTVFMLCLALAITATYSS